MFQKFLPLKHVPTLLFPVANAPCTLTQTNTISIDWNDEKPLCTYTSWNYSLPTKVHTPILHAQYAKQLKTAVVQKLTNISHYDNYLTPNIEDLSAFYPKTRNTSTLFIPPGIPSKLCIRNTSSIKITWLKNQATIHQKVITTPFSIENNGSTVFQYDSLLWIRNFKYTYLPQTQPLPTQQDKLLQAIIRKETALLHLPTGIYQIHAE
ncbi:MAG: hypothetical protein LBH52_02895 [Puniceicoccales bacterium]|jgi:hypothetical protein|nr:hypothetical protein [Puniceicoccales bacterium]